MFLSLIVSRISPVLSGSSIVYYDYFLILIGLILYMTVYVVHNVGFLIFYWNDDRYQGFFVLRNYLLEMFKVWVFISEIRN